LTWEIAGCSEGQDTDFLSAGVEYEPAGETPCAFASTQHGVPVSVDSDPGLIGQHVNRVQAVARRGVPDFDSFVV
jgi:hypothetical protein